MSLVEAPGNTTSGRLVMNADKCSKHVGICKDWYSHAATELGRVAVTYSIVVVSAGLCSDQSLFSYWLFDSHDWVAVVKPAIAEGRARTGEEEPSTTVDTAPSP